MTEGVDVFAGTHRSALTSLDLAADLTLLLSRQALSEYALACGAAQSAAERCGSLDRPPAHAFADLRSCRARVTAGEATLKLVVEALATREAGNVSLDAASSDLIGTLICTTLGRLSADFEASEDEILATATRILGLRAVLDELEVGHDHLVTVTLIETAAARAKPAWKRDP